MPNYMRDFLMFWAVIFIYIWVLSLIFRQHIKSLIKYLPLAAIAQLVYWLTDLRIAMDNPGNPFSVGHRDIYSLYAKVYFVVIISVFIVFITQKSRYALKDKISRAIYIPLFALFPYILYILFKHSKYMLADLLILIFLGAHIFYYVKNDFISRVQSVTKNSLDIFICKKESVLVILIFLVAFVARYTFSRHVLAVTGDRYISASDDGMVYVTYATNWAKGQPGDSSLYWGGYGYWVFMGILYKIFGINNFKILTLMQSLLCALVPVCIFYIAKRVFNKYVGIIASILSILDMNLIFVAGVITMEALFIPMIYVGVLMLILYFQNIKNAKLLYAIFIGIFLGVANIVRGEILFFPFIVCGLIFMFLRKSVKVKRLTMIAFSFLLGFILALLLHATRNYINYNKFTFSTGQAAMCFRLYSSENSKLDKMGFNPFQDSKKSLSAFFANPKEVTKLFATGFIGRTFSLLTVSNFGYFDPVTVFNPSGFFSFRYSSFLLFYGYIFLFLGLILAFKNRERIFEKILILCYMLYTASIYGFIMSTNARHRAVLMPFFYMFLAYGLYSIYKYLKNISCKNSTDM